MLHCFQEPLPKNVKGSSSSAHMHVFNHSQQHRPSWDPSQDGKAFRAREQSPWQPDWCDASPKRLILAPYIPSRWTPCSTNASHGMPPLVDASTASNRHFLHPIVLSTTLRCLRLDRAVSLRLVIKLAVVHRHHRITAQHTIAEPGLW